MGAIHRVPQDESSCVTRGALKNTDLAYPGAFLKEEGIKYFSIGGAAVVGKMVDQDLKDFQSKASRVAYNSYVAVSGEGELIGDGVVPFDWTQLDGAKQIRLDGVVHSINEAGTTIPTDRWYGSETVIDRWLPTVLEELELVGNKPSVDKKSIDFANWKNLLSNLILPSNVPEEMSR
jgi:hypothetical protein